MIVADFHVHSTFSVDGMSTMEQHCIILDSRINMTRLVPQLRVLHKSQPA